MTKTAASSELREESSDPLASVGKEWPSARLKHLVQINPDSISGDEPDDWEIQYVDISSVNSRGEIEETDSMPFEEAPSRAQRLVRDGDTIVSTVRTYLKAIAHVENPPSNMVVSTGFAVLRPGDELVPRFVWRTLQAKPFVDWIVANSEGVSYPAIAPQRLGELVIPHPPIEEQQAVADFLDRRTARIDALVAKQQKLHSLLQERRRSLVSRAVTRGPEGAEDLTTSDVPWLDETPRHWSSAKLKHLVRPHSPITYGIVQAGPHIEDGVPYIRTSDMSGDQLPRSGYKKTSEEIDKQYSRSQVRPGDLVLAIRATVGKALPVPEYLPHANLTQGTARIRPGERVIGEYLLHLLNSSLAEQHFHWLR